MTPEIATLIEDRLGAKCARTREVSGGDINRASKVDLADGRSIFVKTNPNQNAAFFQAEAAGLAWLVGRSRLRVPKVLAVSTVGEAAFLALEFIESGRPSANYDHELGTGLAELHLSGAPSFGLTQDNFIGDLPQRNSCTTNDWANFYWECRLAPLVDSQRKAGLLDAAAVRGFDRLHKALPDLVGEPEPPARLHGDLWGGNAMCDADGVPCLIDPAVYGGHREVDLAMMRLFGGFSAGVFEAYESQAPLKPGAAQRVSLYQLYPLLVHVALFGAGYVPRLRAALARLI